MKKINIDGYTYEVKEKVIGLISETKENFIVSLSPSKRHFSFSATKTSDKKNSKNEAETTHETEVYSR